MSEMDMVLEHLKLISKDISILSVGLANATIIKDLGVMVDAGELRSVLKHMSTSVWACRNLLTHMETTERKETEQCE